MMDNNTNYKQNYERLERLLFNVGEYLYELNDEFRKPKHSEMCFGMTKEEHSKFILGKAKASTPLVQDTNSVYVLTIDNKDDGESDTFETRLFADKTKAIEKAKDIIKAFENECMPELENWKFQKEDNGDSLFYSAWEDGYYDINHYDIKVVRMDIE